MNTLEYMLKLQDGFTGPMKQARDEVGRFIASGKGLQATTANVGGLAGSFGNLAAKIGAAFTAYKALEAGFSGLKKSLSLASQAETTATAFTTMLGSGQAAEALLARIKKLGAETPFEFPELANAGRMLLAFGENARDIPDVLRRIGDVSSAVAAPIGEIAEIYGKARTAGTLFSEDINQLTGRGIPIIRELARVLQQPESAIKNLASEGKITFPLLEQVFRDLTSSGGQFFGMMDQQSRTSAGLFSTLKDTVNELFLEFGKPINDAIKPILTDAIGLAGQMTPIFEQMGRHAAAVMTSVRDLIAQSQEGGSILDALGGKLKAALADAFDMLMIPVRSIVAMLPGIGDALIYAVAPFGRWFSAELEAGAQLFSAVLMRSVAEVLEALPMKMGTAAAQVVSAKALQQSTAGMRSKSDAADAMESIGPSLGAAKDSLMEAVTAGKASWNKELEARQKKELPGLPKSVLDADYNPMFPGGIVPQGFRGGSGLPDSALAPSPWEKIMRDAGAALPISPLAGTAAPSAAAPSAAAPSAAAPSAAAPSAAAPSAAAPSVVNQGPLSTRGAGGIPSRLMGGPNQGPLSTRGAGGIPSRLMGGVSSPLVPSPGTARRSQERREASAATARAGNTPHPLMAAVSEIKAKLNTLAVAT